MATEETADPLEKPRRRSRLRTVDDVRRALARTCRALESGDMEPLQGRALVYAYSHLAKLIAGGDFESRLKLLEERQGLQ